MATENRLTAFRGESLAGWVRRLKGLSKSQKRFLDRQQHSDCQREGG